MARNRSHSSTAHKQHTQPSNSSTYHDSKQRAGSIARDSLPPNAHSSVASRSTARSAPLGDSLSSFVLSASSPPPPTVSLPVVPAPFQRPFSSVQRGLYHQQPWPLHHSEQPQREDGTVSEEPAVSPFVPPHSELPYTASSSFELLAPPALRDSFQSSLSMIDSSRSVSALPSSIRLPYSLSDSSAACAADTPSSSANALVALTLHEEGVDWLVVVFALGAASSSALALLIVPAASVLSSADDSSESSSHPLTLTADLLRSASLVWQSVATDSAVRHIQCCDSPPLPVYSSLASLPLLIAHSEQQAVVYCITRRAASTDSHPAPLLRLTALDTLRPFTSPLLCVAANHRLCSPTACEVAAVDAGGCVYIWTVDAHTRMEQQRHMHSGQLGDESDEEEENATQPRDIPDSGAALDRRHVHLILRSSYDPSSHIAPPSLSFARCLFAPHPRSILLALSTTIVLINVRSARNDGSSSVDIDSRALPMPVRSASSVPVNRYRRAPDRPQLIRDYFFPYQIYRAAERTQQQSVKSEQPTQRKEEKREDGSPGLISSTAPRKPAEYVESGELLDAACVPGFPFVLAVLSSSYVQLVDIRHLEQPMVEWQHEQRYCGGRRPHIIAHTADAGTDQVAGRHVLLLTSESVECAVLLYHCVLGSACGTSAAGAAFTSQSCASPRLLFASMRLPSFGDVSAPSPSAFRLLPFTPQPLVGLCALLSPNNNSVASHSALPPFVLLHLSRSGALMTQRWTAADSPTRQCAMAQEDAAEARTSSEPPLSRAVLSSLGGLLFPSDECAPASLRSTTVRRHDVLDLSAAMHALLHGRYNVQRQQEQPTRLSVLSLESVLSALRGRAEQLRQAMRSPRSADEIALYIAHSGWIQQEEVQSASGHSDWRQQLARCVYHILHEWMERAQPQQLFGHEAVEQPPMPVFHFHAQPPPPSRPVLHHHDQLLLQSADTPFSLHRCDCSPQVLRMTTAQPASECCPAQCCQSPQCILTDAVMFQSQDSVLPSLTFQPLIDDSLHPQPTRPQLQSGGSDRAAASQQRMDLSQDVGTLLQLISQPSTVALSHGLTSGGSKPHSNTRACDELLAGMGKQWRQWQLRALEGPTEEGRTALQVGELDGGWQGLHTAATTAASNGEGDVVVEELTSWQEMADELDENDEDD